MWERTDIDDTHSSNFGSVSIAKYLYPFDGPPILKGSCLCTKYSVASSVQVRRSTQEVLDAKTSR